MKKTTRNISAFILSGIFSAALISGNAQASSDHFPPQTIYCYKLPGKVALTCQIPLELQPYLQDLFGGGDTGIYTFTFGNMPYKGAQVFYHYKNSQGIGQYDLVTTNGITADLTSPNWKVDSSYGYICNSTTDNCPFTNSTFIK